MRNSINTVCDFDAEILEGKKGTADMHKPYISVRGVLMLSTTDPQDPKIRRYTYATDKNSAQTTNFDFCADKDCLHQYLLAKRILQQEYFNKQKEIDKDYFGGYGHGGGSGEELNVITQTKAMAL